MYEPQPEQQERVWATSATEGAGSMASPFWNLDRCILRRESAETPLTPQVRVDEAKRYAMVWFTRPLLESTNPHASPKVDNLPGCNGRGRFPEKGIHGFGLDVGWPQISAIARAAEGCDGFMQHPYSRS